jgi:hypothetical protein
MTWPKTENHRAALDCAILPLETLKKRKTSRTGSGKVKGFSSTFSNESGWCFRRVCRVLISIACAAGIVVFLAGTHGLITLLALVSHLSS